MLALCIVSRHRALLFQCAVLVQSAELPADPNNLLEELLGMGAADVRELSLADCGTVVLLFNRSGNWRKGVSSTHCLLHLERVTQRERERDGERER